MSTDSFGGAVREGCESYAEARADLFLSGEAQEGASAGSPVAASSALPSPERSAGTERGVVMVPPTPVPASFSGDAAPPAKAPASPEYLDADFLDALTWRATDHTLPEVEPESADVAWIDEEISEVEFVDCERPELRCSSCEHVGPPDGFAPKGTDEGPICRECVDARRRVS